MGWEERNGNWYYYRKHRHGDRVVSEYIGCGEYAMLIARLDYLERKMGEDERRVRRIQHDRIVRELKTFRKIQRDVQLLRDAVLIASGYHQHKGQWRKRRG